jgi:hypothetical protein
MTMYMVVRYHRTMSNKIIHTCLSLEAAQEICRDPTTSDPNGRWFYGYTGQLYKVVSRGGRTLATGLYLAEAEALRDKKPSARSVRPVDR